MSKTAFVLSRSHPSVMRTLVFAAVTAVALVSEALTVTHAANFDPRIIAFGDARKEIQSTPVLERPYRPLHVYGNTARRRHQRAGSAGPTSRTQR